MSVRGPVDVGDEIGDFSLALGPVEEAVPLFGGFGFRPALPVHRLGSFFMNVFVIFHAVFLF